MISTVEISDTDDTDDCVIKSVVYVVDDEPDSELYREVYKENKLLADFMEKCLKIENNKSMLRILKAHLLKLYYEADKTARESLKFQKNLRRANYHIRTDPAHVYTHINCLCSILKTLKVKKRVPFVTLTTNLTDKRDEPTKSNIKDINVLTVNSAQFNSSNVSSSDSFGQVCEALEESMSIETCPQSGLIAKKDGLVPNTRAGRIRVIDIKIEQYKEQIALLDELEVDDDSINSPYIQSERLKAKIVSLYNERCQIVGSRPAKFKGIRLELRNGHPPGPTRTLERFLNKNLNKNGDPPFPDFCDVVACVTEANDKDDLGWTKAQIQNEATGLFTLCGEALQKRRQIREYKDLLYNFKMEKDPADDDPALQSKLEENRRIAVKKEADILERYTRLQYVPPKLRAQKNDSNVENAGKENIDQANSNAETQQEIITNINNNNSKPPDVSNSRMEENENNHDNAAHKVNDENIINAPKVKSDVRNHNQDKTHSNVDGQLKNSAFTKSAMDVDGAQNVPSSIDHHIKVDSVQHNTDVRSCDTKMNKVNHNVKIIKPLNKVKHKEVIDCSKISSNNVKSKSNVELKPEEDTMVFFNRLGDNFTVTVEIMNDT